MSTDSTIYTASIRNVELLQREASNTTDLQIYRDGSQIVPSACTYTLRKPDGSTYVVQDAAATVDGSGTCTYTHPANHFPASLGLGEGYIQEWTATISGNTYIFRRTAALCRRRLYPTVTDADLEIEYQDLANLMPASMTSWQQYIDSAWREILRRIRSSGAGYEYLILSPESLHDCLLHLTLYKIWRDMHSSLMGAEGRYMDLANEHYKQYQVSYDTVNWVYDESNSLTASDPDRRTKGQPVVYLTQHGPYRFWRRP